MPSYWINETPMTLDQHRQSIIDRRLPEVPVSYRKLYLRVLNNEASRREAIKAMCLACVGWERQEVKHCTSLACPLYHLRPFKATPEEIANYHKHLESPPWPRTAGSQTADKAGSQDTVA